MQMWGQQATERGSETLPSREVPLMSATAQSNNGNTDKTPVSEQEIMIGISADGDPIPEGELDSLLREIPVEFLRDDEAIFTHLSDTHNPQCVIWITKCVQFSNNLSPEELERARKLVREYTDIFAGSLKEVLPVPGAVHKLHIPNGTMFNLRVHQRPLTPPQLQFLHGKVEEMLEAGIIEHAPPELVKCCANTVLAKKAHEQEGMTLEELQHAVNEQCVAQDHPPAFMLPE